MASDGEPLSVHEARKRLDEIRRLATPPLNPQKAASSKTQVNLLAGRLCGDILQSISLHGDQRTRALMAMYMECQKL